MALLLAVAASILISQSAPAPSADAYAAIVDQYIAGDPAGAVKRLAPNSARLPGEVVAQARQFPDRRVRAAVMMHTELAVAWLIAGQVSPATTQVNNAERLLSILTDDARRRAGSEAFAIRWTAFVTSVYAGQGLFDQAHRTATTGMSAFPRAAELLVARGCVFEMRASMYDGTRNERNLRDAGRDRRELDGLREAAARDFQRAIDIDPALSNAHLHRGWVHHQLGDSRAAADLEAALRHATDDASRYLAHLFLGMVAEHGNGLDAALSEFEAARAIGPYQTSYVALSRVETALGHAERARTIAAEFAQLAPTSEDPWWNYRLGGFSTGALGWLRAEARKP